MRERLAAFLLIWLVLVTIFPARRLAAIYPWAEIKFIPSAYRRINPSDYCD